MKDLVFVAHQDDDLLFMNPDIDNTIDAGGCVRTVYLTAAERGEGIKYMMGRARGVRAAYALMAQSGDQWTEAITQHGGKHQALFTLNTNSRVSMIYMRLEDPWLGPGWGSLTPLSRAESIAGTAAKSLGPYGESYTRQDLVKTLAEIISDYRPTVIRHMDGSITVPYTSLCWRCVGHDHPDHIASARLARDAIAIVPGNYDQAIYVDYPTQERAANLTEGEIAAKTDAFRLYAKDDYRYCPVPALCKEPAGTAASWVGRTYYVVPRTERPALAASAAGGYLLFTTGELNSAANVLNGSDKEWSVLGGRTADGIVAFNWEDGRTGVIARDAMGRLWTNTQTAASVWKGWIRLKGIRSIAQPVVIRLADGRHAALAFGSDGIFHYSEHIIHERNQPGSIWIPLPALADTLPEATMALDAAGHTVVFAADRKGGLWFTSQTMAAGINTWMPWRRFKGIKTSGGLAAMRNGTGRIELYARAKYGGQMLRIVQSLPGACMGSWDIAQNLGTAYIGLPSIGLNEKGQIAVAVLEKLGGTVHLMEASSITSLGEGVESAPAMRSVKGKLFVIARTNDTAQTYRVWIRSGVGWEPSQVLSPPLATGGGSFTDPIPMPVADAPPAADYDAKCCLKKSNVRDQANLAAASS